MPDLPVEFGYALGVIVALIAAVLFVRELRRGC